MSINYMADKFLDKPVNFKTLDTYFKQKDSKNIVPLVTRKTMSWKRLIDLTGAILGIVLLLPLLLIIACYIKIVSPGPILFRQTRIGYGGSLFNCFKYRTMKPNADSSNHQKYLAELINSDTTDSKSASAMTKLHNDPRIIPFGNLIRESGLDELPQLINVLRGEMSLVGPRPAIPYEVAEYKLWYKDRFDVLPGLTGLWQVSGKNRLSFNEMIRLDIQYARHRSFFLDLIIILLTPYALIIQLKDFLAKRQHAQSSSPCSCSE